MTAEAPPEHLPSLLPWQRVCPTLLLCECSQSGMFHCRFHFLGQEARCQMNPSPGPGSLLVGRKEKTLLAVRDRVPWRAYLILFHLVFLRREKAPASSYGACWLQRGMLTPGEWNPHSGTPALFMLCSLLSLFLLAILQPALVILVLKKLRVV